MHARSFTQQRWNCVVALRLLRYATIAFSVLFETNTAVEDRQYTRSIALNSYGQTLKESFPARSWAAI